MFQKAVVRVIHRCDRLKGGDMRYRYKTVVRNISNLELVKEQDSPPQHGKMSLPSWSTQYKWKMFKSNATIYGFTRTVYLWTFGNIQPMFGGCTLVSSYMFPEDLSSWGWLHLQDRPEKDFFIDPIYTDAATLIHKHLGFKLLEDYPRLDSHNTGKD